MTTNTPSIIQKITEGSLLIALHLGRYNPVKTDRSESKKVSTSHGIHNNKLMKVKKHTLPTASVLTQIEKLDGVIRALVDRHCAPYARGLGLLPATKYMDLMDEVRPLFAQREALIKVLADEYSIYRDEAKRELNGAFKPEDYPETYQIVQRFHHSVDVFPIADPRNVRFSVLTEVAEQIQTAVDDTFKEKSESLAPFIREVLLDPLIKFSETLQNPEAIFRDTLISNVQEAAVRAKGLNILGDEEIDSAIQNIESYLNVIPDSLRDDKVIRARTADDANRIIQSLGGSVPEPRGTEPKSEPVAVEATPEIVPPTLEEADRIIENMQKPAGGDDDDILSSIGW